MQYERVNRGCLHREENGESSDKFDATSMKTDRANYKRNGS